MSSKNNPIIFVCSNCGEEYSKWQGRCLNCGLWNTLKEFKTATITSAQKNIQIEITNLAEVKAENFARVSSQILEMDRVLGGGIVPGSVILLGGEPGIGKSTLVMQIASRLKNTYYVSGEESLQQIKMRADRLKVETANVNIIAETNVDAIIAALSKLKPTFVIVDSIQTMYSAEYPSTAGSLVQVRESALRLQKYAKQNNVPVILVGHVTKDGAVAGPKTLEHMVDVVLYLEGERFHDLRILRTTKNRFGATDEIGIFEIGNLGLIEVTNPSKIFLSERSNQTTGSVVTATIEGSRPLLVEIQALVSPSNFGYPKRTASGFDLNRLQLIIAILQNRANLNLSSSDVYLNIAGGFYLKEPAGDLAVAMAIASATKNEAVDNQTIIFGELGLSGEVRPVSLSAKRMSEAKRLGFTKSIFEGNIQTLITQSFKFRKLKND